MRIDEFEFQDEMGNEIEPTKNQLVVYIKSLHNQIKELQQLINNYKYAAFRASEFIKQNDELKAQITKCKKALNLMASDWCLIDNPNNPDAIAKQYMEKAERE